MYTISSGIYGFLDFQFICKSRHSVHIMCTISRGIYAVLDFQFICKSRHSVHNFPLNLYISRYSISLQIQIFRTYIMYTVFRLIYAVPDFQFICKSRHSVYLYCTQFPVELMKLWIFNFSTKQDIPYI